MSIVRPIWLNLAILAAIGLQADVVFAQVFNGLQRQGDTSSSAQGPHYFTIMGHVAQPNCYELPTASPSLVGFAQLAGDLTRTAGGPIHIVRDGRIVQSTFYSNKSTLRLVPGDIVVVDGKVNQGRIIHRGNQAPSDSNGGDVSLAITGLRDYAIVLNIPADRATIRWVTRHLGLDAGVASHVKATTPRQSAPVYPDSRLVTGTVLAFDPSMVDQSRLPDDLPVPVKAGRQPAAVIPPTQQFGPLVQQPQVQYPPTAMPGVQYGAAPGRARVPNIGPESPPETARPESLNLPREEQAFVQQLLTDPDSVPLDVSTPEPAGQAFVSRPPMSQQRSTSPPAASADAATSHSSVGRGTANEASAGTEATTFSPEAPRPYQSVPAVPEPLQPLGSSRPSSAEVDSSSETESNARDSSRQSLDKPRSENGFSFAATAAGLAASADHSDPAVSSATNKLPPAEASPSDAGLTPVTPVGPIQSGDSAGGTLAQAGSASTAAGGRNSRLLPPPPGGPNWPVISICVVGLLGAIAASFLIYSIANEHPAPRVAQIDKSGRYWLDRMIENDIPIVEEKVNYPHNTQLFGKPAPIQRIDAAHKAVPRPHFSAPGGKSGVLKENPAMPDAPSPDISPSGQSRIVKVHSGRPGKRQGAAAVPSPHSVHPVAAQRQDTAGTPVSENSVEHVTSNKAASDSSSKPGRTFRVDSGTESVEPSNDKADKPVADSGVTVRKDKSTVAGDTSMAGPNFLKEGGRTQSRETANRRSVAVQPSPIVVEGANLLDRILSTVGQHQPASRRSTGELKQGERQSEERGNS